MKIQKLMRNTGRGLVTLVIASGLGCSLTTENTFSYRSEYKGYPAEIGMYRKSDDRYVKIGVDNSVYGDQNHSNGEISAYDKGNIGRFDIFYRTNLLKGHPLEIEFNSFESMEKAYSELRAEYESKSKPQVEAELNDTEGEKK